MDARQRRHQQRKEYLKSKKRVPCADCGNTFPEVCMDFHHIDKDTKDEALKGYNKNSMVVNMRRWSIDRIDAELSTCVVLCACCHRLRHASK